MPCYTCSYTSLPSRGAITALCLPSPALTGKCVLVLLVTFEKFTDQLSSWRSQVQGIGATVRREALPFDDSKLVQLRQQAGQIGFFYAERDARYRLGVNPEFS